MKNLKKILAVCLTVVMTICVMSFGAFADDATDELKFYATDENGNVIEVLDVVYLDHVAEAYEQRKLQRWTSTTYYNLSQDPLTISGGSSIIVECSKHFNANSSGRLYYNAEVTGTEATLDIYDITNNRYQGSVYLTHQGNGVYLRNGYVSGLSSSSTRYYSFGISGTGVTNFSSYYATVSWNSL